MLSTGVVLLAFISLGTRYAGAKFAKSLHLSALPSMIILTRGDEIQSKKTIADSGKSFRRMTICIVSALSGIIINIASSYLYARLSG